MKKQVMESVGEFYQYYPSITTIVTAQANGKANAMTVAWHCPLSRTPSLYAVAIRPNRFTYQLITQSGEFAVNFLPGGAAELVRAIGGTKGAEINKFQKLNIAQDKPAKTSAPILSEAYVAYECRLIDTREYGDHHLMVGEIVAVHQAPDVFLEDETLNLDRIRPSWYLGNNRFVDVVQCNVKTLDRDTCVQLRQR